MTSVPQGSVLGPTLLNFFASDMDRGIECTLSNFAGNMLEERDAIQRGTWMVLVCGSHAKLTKFIKAKCKILYLAQASPKYKYSLGNE